jgi:hypothetical protein
VLGLLVLRGKADHAKDLELVVFRHELGILRRQVQRVDLNRRIVRLPRVGCWTGVAGVRSS